MALGRKTGGRVAGTPNKRTAEITERLAALGCDPIEGMARLAMDESNAPELRGRMFAELAQYVAPKRKAIEHSTEDGLGLANLSCLSDEAVRSLSMAELTDLVLQRIAAGEVEPDRVTGLMAHIRSGLVVRN